MDAGMVGGIIGAVVGVLGGLFGTYCSVKNTQGPKERAFMVQFALTTWIAVSVFLALLFLLPQPWNFLLWIPYAIALPLSIRFCNKRQLVIRESERTSQAVR